MSHLVDPGPGAKKLDGPDVVSTLFVESYGEAATILGACCNGTGSSSLSTLQSRYTGRVSKNFLGAFGETTYP
jgi:hypothetical protein